MRAFFPLLFLFFSACSEPSNYFSLQVREDSFSNIDTTTPFNISDIESAFLGFSVQKIHSVHANENQSLILVRKNAVNVAYIYPDNESENIAYIEIVHPYVKTSKGLHVGMKLEEVKKKISLTCKDVLTCKEEGPSNLEYIFTKEEKLEYIVLTLK